MVVTLLPPPVEEEVREEAIRAAIHNGYRLECS